MSDRSIILLGFFISDKRQKGSGIFVYFTLLYCQSEAKYTSEQLVDCQIRDIRGTQFQLVEPRPRARQRSWRLSGESSLKAQGRT